MKFLLDTHVWIWAMERVDDLPAAVGRELVKASNLPFGISAISIWETSRKENLGKLRLSTPMRDWLHAAVKEPFVRLLPMTIDIAQESNHLPGKFHRDPADQIIVATARVLGLTLITADSRILAYPHVRTLWG